MVNLEPYAGAAIQNYFRRGAEEWGGMWGFVKFEKVIVLWEIWENKKGEGMREKWDDTEKNSS